MRGFPKHLNTAQDIENVKDFYPKETADHLQKLAEGRFIWQDAGRVGEKEVVEESADLRVIQELDEAGKPTLRKLERVEDPGAQLFQLGLATAEVEALIELKSMPVKGDPLWKSQ
jgi:hypothetical protein